MTALRLIAPKIIACSDCSAQLECDCIGNYYSPGHDHWVLGQIRCKPCGDAKREIWRAERAKEDAEKQARIAAHIAADCPDDGEVCENCCEHDFDPDEGFMCLSCNKSKYD